MKSTLAFVVLLVYAPVIFCQVAVDSDTTKTKQHHFFKKKLKHLEQTPYSDIPYCASCEIQLGNPEELLLDDDADGVLNVFDLELNTIAFASVDVNGVGVDSDGDGVLDCFDNDVGLPIYNSSKKMIDSIIHENGYPCKSLMDSDYDEWILPLIFFDFNSNIPNSESLDDLKNIVKLLIYYPNLTIEIDGNYDYDNENSYLGVLRMYYVANFLINEGVDGNNIRLKYDDFQNSANKLILHHNVEDLSVFYRVLWISIN
jgi:hypothetical protein